MLFIVTLAQHMVRKQGRIVVSLEDESQQQKGQVFPSASRFQGYNHTICSPQSPSDDMLSVVKYYNLAIRLIITVVMNGNEGYYGQLSCGLKLISLELISYGHIITKLCLYLYIAYLLSTLG